MRVTDSQSEPIQTMRLHPYFFSGALFFLMLGLLFIPRAWGGESKRDIVMIVDNSGSMKKNDPEFLAHRALKAFVSANDDDTRLALIRFDKSVKLSVPFTPLNDASRSLLFDAINEIDYSGPLTNSPQALERAIYEFALHGRDDAGKSIVFITDGIVDTGNKVQDKLQETRMQNEFTTLASKLDIRIFAIAFAEAANYPLIGKLASKTKGEYFNVLTAAELPDVFTSIEALSRHAAVTQIQGTQPAKGALVPQSEIQTNSEIRYPAGSIAESSKSKVNTPVVKPNDIEATPTREDNTAQLQPLSVADVLLNKAHSFYAGNELIIYCAALIALIALSALLLSRKGSADATSSHRVENSSFADDRLGALLIDIDNQTATRNHPLSNGIIRIGRAKTKTYNDDIHHLWIDKATIGREHAFIEYRNGGYWLSDNDSTNGTFVNGKRIRDSVRLKDGSRISFHDVEFVFSIPDLGELEKTVSVPVFNPRQSTVQEQDTLLFNTQHTLRTASQAGTNVNRAQTDIRTHKRFQENTRLRSANFREQNSSKTVSNTDILQNLAVSKNNKGTAVGTVNSRKRDYASRTLSESQASTPLERNTEKLEIVKLQPDTNTAELEPSSKHSNTVEIQALPASGDKKKSAVRRENIGEDTVELDIV